MYPCTENLRKGCSVLARYSIVRLRYESREQAAAGVNARTLLIHSANAFSLIFNLREHTPRPRGGAAARMARICGGGD
eukprot:4415933-Prymnesium_polylepis.4